MFSGSSRSNSRKRSHGSSCRKRIGGVERRAAPKFKAEQFRRAPRHGVRDGHHVGRCARAIGQQGLVRVAKKVVSVIETTAFFFLERPFAKPFGTQLPAAIAGVPGGGFVLAVATAGDAGFAASWQFRRAAFRVGIAVDDDVAEEREQLGRAITLARLELEKFRRGDRSINVVVAESARKTGLWMTFSRNGIFVFTPRIRNSRSARSMRCSAISSNVCPIAVTFTSSES